MNLPTAYEIREHPLNCLKPNINVIIKSKLPIPDKEVQKGIKERISAIYTYTVKNIYKGGEKIIEIK